MALPLCHLTYAEARRNLRLVANLAGTVGSSVIGKHKVVISDISRAGCRVEKAMNIQVGSTVVVTIQGLNPVGAQVRWVTASEIGLHFNRTLHPLIIAEILKSKI